MAAVRRHRRGDRPLHPSAFSSRGAPAAGRGRLRARAACAGLTAVKQNSQNAKIFCLVHKMDQIPEEQRDQVFQQASRPPFAHVSTTCWLPQHSEEDQEQDQEKVEKKKKKKKKKEECEVEKLETFQRVCVDCFGNVIVQSNKQ